MGFAALNPSYDPNASPSSPPVSAASPAQSSRSTPCRTKRCNDESGQSRTRLTRLCLPGSYECGPCSAQNQDHPETRAPIATLPNAASTLAARLAESVRPPAGHGRTLLDEPPAHGEIGCALRQCPDRMQMVGQHDNGIDREGIVPSRVTESGAEQVDVFGQQAQTSLGQIDREEITAASDAMTPIICRRSVCPALS